MMTGYAQPRRPSVTLSVSHDLIAPTFGSKRRASVALPSSTTAFARASPVSRC